MAEKYTLETLGKAVDDLLDEGYKWQQKAMKGGVFEYFNRARFCLEHAKLLWENNKHLIPKELKLSGEIKTKSSMVKSGVVAGKPPAPLPNNPVDIEGSRAKGKISFKITPKMVDPTIIILLSDWLVDYVYARYGTPELQKERRIEQEYSRNYWIYYLNGYDISGSKIEPGNSEERLDRYKEWRRNNVEV